MNYDAIIVSFILVVALVLFMSDRVRPDAVALMAALACYLTGVISLPEALAGFSSRAVITVAAILVIGRALELSGGAAALTRILVPRSRFIFLPLAGLLLMGVLLSAFMNNIAALVITMPAAIAVAREHRLPPGALLMPLSFATILGGTTTLIGTPANLVLSQVREDELGAPFEMFSMTLIGGAVAGAGIVYLLLIGWRLTPRRRSNDGPIDAARVIELGVPHENAEITLGDLRKRMRAARAPLIAILRNRRRVLLKETDTLWSGDRILALSAEAPWPVAERANLDPVDQKTGAEDAVTARVTVGHGSPLIDLTSASVEERTTGTVRVVARGLRAARLRAPLDLVRIEVGDELHLHGGSAAVAQFVRSARLFEVDRQMLPPASLKPALRVLGIYALAVAVSTLLGVSTTLSFVVAALAIAMLRLIPSDEIYRSIDWPIIVLLACMIPVGRAFDDSGATTYVADILIWSLSSSSVPIMLGAICGVSMLLSVFLNNVATALIMGSVGVQVAQALGIPADAALLAVLIGASSDFLTPVGHQNNLIVMRPGGYRFSDYPKMGAPLSIIVVVLTAFLLTEYYT